MVRYVIIARAFGALSSLFLLLTMILSASSRGTPAWLSTKPDGNRIGPSWVCTPGPPPACMSVEAMWAAQDIYGSTSSDLYKYAQKVWSAGGLAIATAVLAAVALLLVGSLFLPSVAKWRLLARQLWLGLVVIWVWVTFVISICPWSVLLGGTNQYIDAIRSNQTVEVQAGFSQSVAAFVFAIIGSFFCTALAAVIVAHKTTYPPLLPDDATTASSAVTVQPATTTQIPPHTFSPTANPQQPPLLYSVAPMPSAGIGATSKPPTNIPAPIISPPTGSYSAPLTVTISCPSAPMANLHFTLNGSSPNEQSTLYRSPFVLITPGQFVVRAMAMIPGVGGSAFSEAVLNIVNPAATGVTEAIV